MKRLRQWSRALLSALLAWQLVVGAPVHARAMPAQPITSAVADVVPAVAPMAAEAMSAHCGEHALQQAPPAQQPAANAGRHDHRKGCCSQTDCAMGSCGDQCGSALALTPSRLEGSALVPAEPAHQFMAEPRVDRRAFEFFRPPI